VSTELPESESEATSTNAPHPPPAEAPSDDQRETFARWRLAVLGLAAVLAGITMIIVLGWLQAPGSNQSAETGRLASPSSASSPAVQSGPAPTWVGRRQATWARDGSKTISFELQATSDVAAWMTRVRPRLVVRCVSRSTEVFVAIGSAASIESQAGSHTVRLQIDDDPEVVQQWSDSESGQELFAPDGLTLARRLARAQRMRFGFTPYNVTPVTTEFAVQGFDQFARLVASTCGWRLEGPATPAGRSARLN